MIAAASGRMLQSRDMNRRDFYVLLFVAMAGLPSVALGQSTVRPRQSWNTSRIAGSPEPPRPYVAERIFPSLSFHQPVELVAVPDTNRLIALELNGKIFSFEN